MAPTRWGIASTGRITFDFTNALSLLPASDHKVIAVAARALPSAEKFAAQFNIPKSYGSYKELAEDPDIDIVYVGTITVTHFALCKMLIEAGKNVLCEKPMTMTADEAKAILALAKERGVFFLEGIWSRFFPVYDRLREELHKKTIGEVKYIQVDFGYAFKKEPHINLKERGDGALLALGCYPVQLAQLIFGEYPERIVANGTLTEDGVDEADFITLHYSGKRVAQFSCHTALNMLNVAVIIGTKGTIKLPNFWCPDSIEIAGVSVKYPLPKAPKPMNFFQSDGFIYEAEAVRQCLINGKKETVQYPHQESVWTMSILTEVLKQLGVTYN